ncbi:MAG: CbiX/SirB N-terminal domain-containing protein [Candidatus Sumerlaeota bacterium]
MRHTRPMSPIGFATPAVLIVVHGSRNSEWVSQQQNWFANVGNALREEFPGLRVELSFLEITAPLFEDRFRELSLEHEHLLVLPFFLVQGGHVLKDIPAIADGCLADSHSYEIIGSDQFSVALGVNAEHRLHVSHATTIDEIIVCGYGSSGSVAHWLQLIVDIRAHAGTFCDQPWHWAATGHFLPDSSAPLRSMIETLRASGKRHLAILPLYLGISSYQNDLIPRVMKEFPDVQFHFMPTSILPDLRIERWAVDAIARALQPRGVAP